MSALTEQERDLFEYIRAGAHVVLLRGEYAGRPAAYLCRVRLTETGDFVLHPLAKLLDAIDLDRATGDGQRLGPCSEEG